MSLGDLLPVAFYELAFIGAFLLLPVVAFRGDLENFMFGALVLYMIVRVIRRRKRTVLPADGKAVFISGCDSGFGHMFAKRLHEKGFTVFAGCLVPEGEGAQSLKSACAENLHVVPLDVTSDDSVKKAGLYVRENLGDYQLWGVVNNAGIYGHGDVELCSIQTYMTLADVNLYGMIRLTQEFLPLIRKSKGRIVNMSSINGRYPWPSTSAYNASKYGIECVSDCLRIEMRKFGVKVVLIEPAMFGGSTDIHSLEHVKRHYESIDRQLSNSSEQVRETYSRNYLRSQIDVILHFKQSLNAKSPDVVIDAVQEGIMSSAPQCRYVCHGGPWPVDPLALFGLVYPYLPEFVTDWLIARATGHHSLDLLKAPAWATSNSQTNDQKSE